MIFFGNFGTDSPVRRRVHPLRGRSTAGKEVKTLSCAVLCSAALLLASSCAPRDAANTTEELCSSFTDSLGMFGELFGGTGMGVTRCGERFGDLVIELTDPVDWPVDLWNEFGPESLMLELPVSLLASHVKETGSELGSYEMIVFGYPDQGNFELRFPSESVEFMVSSPPSLGPESLRLAMAASEVGSSDGSQEAILESITNARDTRGEADGEGSPVSIAEPSPPASSTPTTSTSVANSTEDRILDEEATPEPAAPEVEAPVPSSAPVPTWDRRANERVMQALEWSEDTLETLNAQISEDLRAVNGYITDLHAAPLDDRAFMDGLHVARMTLDARFNGYQDRLFDVRASRSWLDKVDRSGAQENLAHSLNEMAVHTDAWIAYYLALQSAAETWTYEDLVIAGRNVVNIYTLPGSIGPILNNGYEQQQISITFRAVCGSMWFAVEQLSEAVDLAQRVADMCSS